MRRAGYELCVITRAAPARGRGHVEVAQAALLGGARFLQFRDKEMTTRELLETGRVLRQLTRDFGAKLVVNDRVDVALAVGADGVHVGAEDMPLWVARRLLGEKAVIGASAGTVEAAQLAQAAGADYLGVGPVYPTGSKADAGEAIGLERLGAIAEAVEVPVLGIGGITAANAEAVVRAGAAGVAVISAVSDAEDMVAATEELLRAVESEAGRVGR